MAALSRRVAQLFQLIGVPLRLVALFQISDGLFLYFLKGFSLGTAGAVLMKDKIQKHAEQGHDQHRGDPGNLVLGRAVGVDDFQKYDEADDERGDLIGDKEFGQAQREHKEYDQLYEQKQRDNRQPAENQPPEFHVRLLSDTILYYSRLR